MLFAIVPNLEYVCGAWGCVTSPGPPNPGQVQQYAKMFDNRQVRRSDMPICWTTAGLSTIEWFAVRGA